MITLEVCANSVTSAIAGQEGGAVRVELCENLEAGGTTPSYGQLLLARKYLHIKLYALIRPRSGDFLYTDLEFEMMLADVRACIETGCDGVVIGMLNADGSIDVKRCTELVRLARQWGLGVTFHRAFDMCNNLFLAMEQIIEMGCERILTSGGKSTGMEGASVIAQLVEKAAGRISIMPGSGVNETNVANIVRFTGVTEVHSTAKVRVPGKMEYHNESILMGNSFGDDGLDITNADKVREVIKAANSVA